MTKHGLLLKKILFLGLASAAISMSNAALADGGAKFVGNITTGGQIRDDFNTYWNQITPENGCKWGSIHSLSNGMSGKSVFNWDNYDKCASAYEWAKEKPGERHFKFHALVWGSQYPSFLCKKKNPSITVEKTRQYITEWFDAVAERFPDLEYIDVVNEAIWSDNNYHSGYLAPAEGAEGVSTDDKECGGSYIIEALGGDEVINGKHQYNFITTAFNMAHERWPNAVLIYNDYNTLSWQMNEGIELVKTIIKNGAPVDAYGQQGHDCKDLRAEDWTDQWGNKQLSFSNRLKKIHEETGLPLFITEYDIGDANDESQKNVIAQQIPFLWETEWIAGITIWGYIDGATWRSNTGLMTPNGDVKSNPNVSATNRSSMTWLEQYFSEHLADGKNTTGMGGGTTIESVPQKPFNATNSPWAIPGKIEAEDFDITGSGKNEDGSSSISYNDKDSENHGGSSYRTDAPSVDIYEKAFGTVIGYNEVSDWYEYTINVEEAGDYTLFVAVASANNTNGFKFSLDGNDITEELSAPKAEVEDSYDEFDKISVNVTISTTGKHILRLTVTGDWFDIDYFNFVKGQNAEDDVPLSSSATTSNSSSSSASSPNSSVSDNPISSATENPNSSASNNPISSATENPNSSASDNPISSATENPNSSASNNPISSASSNPTSSTSSEIGPESSANGSTGKTDASTAIGNNLHIATQGFTDYDIIDIHGVRIGRLSALSTQQAIETAKYSNIIKSSGIYYIRSKATGKIKSLRIIR